MYSTITNCFNLVEEEADEKVKEKKTKDESKIEVTDLEVSCD